MDESLFRAFFRLPPAREPKSEPAAKPVPPYVAPPMRTWVVTDGKTQHTVQAHFFVIEGGVLYAYEQTGIYFGEPTGRKIAGWRLWTSFHRVNSEPAS